MLNGLLPNSIINILLPTYPNLTCLSIFKIKKLFLFLPGRWRRRSVRDRFVRRRDGVRRRVSVVLRRRRSVSGLGFVRFRNDDQAGTVRRLPGSRTRRLRRRQYRRVRRREVVDAARGDRDVQVAAASYGHGRLPHVQVCQSLLVQVVLVRSSGLDQRRRQTLKVLVLRTDLRTELRTELGFVGGLGLAKLVVE